MNLQPEVCFRALAARDPRFDGTFFVGVVTTGIYCRPICPARTPARERCRFFPHPAAAECEGFRPCLRCRPELAPGCAAVDSVGRTARLVAERIAAGALNHGGTLAQLAQSLGIGTRQLRRIVQQQFGVSPIELAQTKRLLLAKQLLAETRLPLIDVALASGFASVRRFNALFRDRYGLTPTAIRRSAAVTNLDAVQLLSAYRPPYAWRSLLDFLSARSTAGVECVVDGAYLRTVQIEGHRGWIRVEHLPAKNSLAVCVATELLPVLAQVMSRVRRLFDVDARPDPIASHLQTDSRLAQAVASTPGLRVPGAFDEFELVVRAILGQRISVRAATTLAGRLANAWGMETKTPFPELHRFTPSAARLATAERSQLRSLGIGARQAASITAAASALVSRELSLDSAVDPDELIRRLQQLPGIGEWTAQYIALRAVHWPDAFPHGDLGLLRAAGQHDPHALRRLAEAWRPWRAYAAFYLWNSQATG